MTKNFNSKYKITLEQLKIKEDGAPAGTMSSGDYPTGSATMSNLNNVFIPAGTAKDFVNKRKKKKKTTRIKPDKGIVIPGAALKSNITPIAKRDMGNNNP